MPETIYLIDTCSYFRLGKHIHPLINQPFGKDKITIKILKELEEEAESSDRLESKFVWFSEKKYDENRKPYLRFNKNEKRKMAKYYPFFENMGTEYEPPASPTDLKCLIAAYIKDDVKAVITDDRAMYFIATDLSIDIMSSIRFLHYLLSEDEINISRINKIISHWVTMNDLPKDCQKEYKILFGNPPENLFPKI